MHEEWGVIGDFNIVLTTHEREGVPCHNLQRDSPFLNDVVKDCGLTDANYVGLPFTWSKGCQRAHLDRLLVNQSWCLRFQRESVFHLHSLKSDHNPLLVRMDMTKPLNHGRRLFQF